MELVWLYHCQLCIAASYPSLCFAWFMDTASGTVLSRSSCFPSRWGHWFATNALSHHCQIHAIYHSGVCCLYGSHVFIRHALYGVLWFDKIRYLWYSSCQFQRLWQCVAFACTCNDWRSMECYSRWLYRAVSQLHQIKQLSRRRLWFTLLGLFSIWYLLHCLYSYLYESLHCRK